MSDESEAISHGLSHFLAAEIGEKMCLYPNSALSGTQTAPRAHKRLHISRRALWGTPSRRSHPARIKRIKQVALCPRAIGFSLYFLTFFFFALAVRRPTNSPTATKTQL
jgi:hypothetical protein